MTDEERLEELERWLLEEYNATFEIWTASSRPDLRASLFVDMQTLARVARHLICGRDDLVPLYDERLIVYTRHLRVEEIPAPRRPRDDEE